MFNMKTSDLFKRAKQLADLEGSDFISWNEAISCINESNVSLYEKLISMGDNSFVKSYRTTKEEEELPEDFWQLKGVWLWNNGNLQTINRRADNNGVHHLSYELRNGKLYLFGNPNDVLVEYFPKPEKLYFKPHDVAISLDTTKEYLDCHKHTFLYKDTDESENETLSIIDLDGIKTSKDFMQIAHTDIVRAFLTENFVFVVTENDMTIYDIMSGYSATITGYAPLITESGKEYIIDNESGVIKYFHIGNGSFSTSEINVVEPIAGGEFYVCNDDMTDFFYMLDDDVMHNGEATSAVTAKHIIYSDKKCYVLGDTGYALINAENEVILIENSTGLNVGFIGIDERTGYGYCTKKFGAYYVCPYCEDTPLNYPSSLYFQIISYILAIAFKSKQGADVSLLSSQLAMAEQTFEETLGSDAFQFPRMGNVYN
jgi:hypothetical protein